MCADTKTYEFKGQENFIFDWYWKVQNNSFRTKPNEKDLILSLLRETNSETNKLYDRIINDKRFEK